METRKIDSDLVELRKEIGGLQAKKVAGVPYAVKSARELFYKLRLAADKLKMIEAGSLKQVILIPENSEKGTKACAVVTVRFKSSDGSYEDFQGGGSGMAPDDKGANKAITYATKNAVVAALCLPDAEMVDSDDESIPDEAYDWIDKIEAVDSKGALEDLKVQLGKLPGNIKQHTIAAFNKKKAELDG